MKVKLRLLIRLVLVKIFFLTALLAKPAFSQELTDADYLAMHAVVQSQLDAVAKDDAESAFALMAMSTQIQFGSSDNFLRAVKREYAPLYRYRVALFSEPEIINGNPIQLVRLADRDGGVWLAIYQLLREEDGTWKIEGCRLIETSSISL